LPGLLGTPPSFPINDIYINRHQSKPRIPINDIYINRHQSRHQPAVSEARAAGAAQKEKKGRLDTNLRYAKPGRQAQRADMFPLSEWAGHVRQAVAPARGVKVPACGVRNVRRCVLGVI
jgi:hypothetical protein